MGLLHTEDGLGLGADDGDTEVDCALGANDGARNTELGAADGEMEGEPLGTDVGELLGLVIGAEVQLLGTAVMNVFGTVVVPSTTGLKSE